MTISATRRAAFAVGAAFLFIGGAAFAQSLQLDLDRGRIDVVPREERRGYDERRGQRYLEEESGGLTCGEGRRIVRERGYSNVRPIDCGGRTFTYAARERGAPVEVRVSARSGRIVSVEPL
jgi:hypothetical protein